MSSSSRCLPCSRSRGACGPAVNLCFLRSTASVAALTLIAGCASLGDVLDASLLFRARPSDADRLAQVARIDGIEEVRIAAPDGVVLHGWLKHPPAARRGERFPLVIFFGGVARETSWMVGWGDKPPEWGWLLINYRGYGLSNGVPSEHAVVEDARRIFDYAAARPDVDRTRIVVLGRSLGSYVAVTLAAARPLAAAILATPFDSITAVAEQRYPHLPVALLLGGRYDSAALAPTIKLAALFVIADADDVTPPTHGHALMRAWGGPKSLVLLANTRHRGLEWRTEYWQQLSAFLRSIPPESGKASVPEYPASAEKVSARILSPSD